MRALLFDTETTALIDNHLLPLDKQLYVVEWCSQMVDLGTGKVLQVLEHIIKPPIPLPEDTTRITGITPELLEGKPPFAAVAAEIKQCIEAASCVISHNFSFDKEATEIEYERLGQKVQWPILQLCSVEQSVHYRGYRLSLTNLHEHLFGQPMKEAHRARTDVEALTRCAVEMFRRGDL